jgi:membrane-bound metal-dependent hydrolase YbcI (DUF457 family)
MPSPLGHVLAGTAVAALASSTIARGVRSKPDASARDVQLKPDATGRRLWFLDPLVVTTAFIAAAPDLDLLVSAWHRKGTHSLLATALVMIVTMVVTGKVTGRINWKWVLVLGTAHASHLVTDWLGEDPSLPAGLQILWPFSNEFYKSGLDFFPRTERNFADLARVVRINLWAFFVESLVWVPLVWMARKWAATRTRRSRVPISGQAVPRPPSA